MNANTKLEIAVEIMAAKIAKTSREEESEEKLNKLLKEKTKMYQGDEEIIEKIITRPIIIKNLKTLKILEAKIQEILKIENMLVTLEAQKP